ncbi:MAG: calcium-binding protein [Gammaproteobacteria bacterium]|nr:calcium-binding protein [Gammaproteobacteria bacterium]
MAKKTSTAGADVLAGTNVDDILLGLAGNDHLTGRGGDDVLNGGLGVDLLSGGAGNDTYLIDNASEINKAAPDAGIDTVKTTVTYTLGAQQERLTLLGSTAINGAGNALDNSVRGNSAANTLKGGLGIDLLSGEAGNDVLVYDPADVAVNGGAGTDTLQIRGSGVTANLLTATTLLSGLEVIDLTGTGNTPWSSMRRPCWRCRPRVTPYG